jgi:hypothetical protein
LGSEGVIGNLVTTILFQNGVSFKRIDLRRKTDLENIKTRDGILINCAYDFKATPKNHVINNISIISDVIEFCNVHNLKLINISTSLVNCSVDDQYAVCKRIIENNIIDVQGVNLRLGTLDLEQSVGMVQKMLFLVKKIRFIPKNFTNIPLHLTKLETLEKGILQVIYDRDEFASFHMDLFDAKMISLFTFLAQKTNIKKSYDISLLLIITYQVLVIFEGIFNKTFLINSISLGRLIFPCEICRYKLGNS